ncbi:MAG: histidine--tRNA ligase [Eubacterium pyruvativorans]|uniref:histidine--tRNA ligase n=1 Tax=Eubacterium pyruvativorans TaxID=155865 RepID=UPI002A80C3CC|nr:histidine--tRNA ligase [Eubacterium pyruvativorans]MDY4050093.1 histidine--tRNA ligase [Eubacterium pyruvativorans]
MLTAAPRGTKDILPDQIYKWQFVEKKFRAMCEKYGFREIRTPMFEHTELFNRGVGDSTDIVEKEMYTFDDRGHRSLTLKPEGTSPAVRAFVENKLFAEVQPVKMFYETPCFRYEKPQAGRLREFHQFGIEVFGTPDMLSDAEVIYFASDFLQEMGVKNTRLEINSVGCPECRARYRKKLQDFLRPRFDELSETSKDRFDRNPMRILDSKSEIDQQIAEGAPMMIDNLCDSCRTAFEDLKANLDAMGMEYTVNPLIVRGLDYYTKTAFEFVSTGIGAQSTVCGGGRYDHLIEEIGGPEVPGVGFGLGIERLLLLMEENGYVIPEPDRTDVFIAFMGDQAKREGLSILHRLRQAGVRGEMDTLARKVKGQFKYANRLRAKYTVMIGDEEIEKGIVQLKDMDAHAQQEVRLEDLIDTIRENLGC